MPNTLKKYLAVLKISFLNAVTYRTEFLISIFGWGIRLSIGLFLWSAVAKTHGQVGEYTFPDILRYFFIVQIISSFIFSRVAFDINEDIISGDFSNYIIKPMAYLPFRMVDEMSSNFFRTLLATGIFGTLLVFLEPDFLAQTLKSPSLILLFIFSLAFAYAINFCIISIIAVWAFWITNSKRFTFIYFGLLTILAGIILPLDLFPEKIFSVLKLLPFPYIFYFPAKILQASLPARYIMENILLPQAIFLITGVTVLWIVYVRGVKKYEACGK